VSKSICLVILATLVGTFFNNSALAATCTATDFAAAVDSSGAALRTFNAKALPKLKDRLRQLKEKEGWADAGYEERALGRVRDKRTSEYDAKAEDLIVKIDTFGGPTSEQTPNCSKLAELNAAGRELLAVMKAKSAYTLAKLDAAIAGDKRSLTPTRPRTQTPSATKPPNKNVAKSKVATAEPPSVRAKTPPAKVPAKPQLEPWSTQTNPDSKLRAASLALYPPALPASSSMPSANLADRLHMCSAKKVAARFSPAFAMAPESSICDQAASRRSTGMGHRSARISVLLGRAQCFLYIA